MTNERIESLLQAILAAIYDLNISFCKLSIGLQDEIAARKKGK